MSGDDEGDIIDHHEDFQTAVKLQRVGRSMKALPILHRIQCEPVFRSEKNRIALYYQYSLTLKSLQRGDALAYTNHALARTPKNSLYYVKLLHIKTWILLDDWEAKLGSVEGGKTVHTCIELGRYVLQTYCDCTQAERDLHIAMLEADTVGLLFLGHFRFGSKKVTDDEVGLICQHIDRAADILKVFDLDAAYGDEMRLDICIDLSSMAGPLFLYLQYMPLAGIWLRMCANFTVVRYGTRTLRYGKIMLDIAGFYHDIKEFRTAHRFAQIGRTICSSAVGFTSAIITDTMLQADRLLAKIRSGHNNRASAKASCSRACRTCRNMMVIGVHELGSCPDCLSTNPTYYCSQECLDEDFPRHQHECGKPPAPLIPYACNSCRAPNAPLVCRCWITRYCGKECQAKHWKAKHKNECNERGK